jgi:hypothetical protein
MRLSRPEIGIAPIKLSRFRLEYDELGGLKTKILLGRTAVDHIFWALDHEFTHWLFIKMFGKKGEELNDAFDKGIIKGYYVRYLAEPTRFTKKNSIQSDRQRQRKRARHDSPA